MKLLRPALIATLCGGAIFIPTVLFGRWVGGAWDPFGGCGFPDYIVHRLVLCDLVGQCWHWLFGIYVFALWFLTKNGRNERFGLHAMVACSIWIAANLAAVILIATTPLPPIGN